MTGPLGYYLAKFCKDQFVKPGAPGPPPPAEPRPEPPPCAGGDPKGPETPPTIVGRRLGAFKLPRRLAAGRGPN